MSWVRVVSFLIAFLLVQGANAATPETKKRVRATIKPASAGVVVRGAPGDKSALAVGQSKKNGSVASARNVRPALAAKDVKYATKASPRARRVTVFEDEDPENLSVRSAAALVIDLEQGQSVYEKNPGSVMPIASITKLMTAMVVLDAELPLDEPIAITEDDLDAMKGTRSRLPVGAVLTRRELLRLALMASENSAAAALGRSYPGGTSTFVLAMNRKARAIGTRNTYYVEPTGLSSSNVSTARDLGQIVRTSYRYQLIREFSTTESYEVEIAEGRERLFHNTNGLVRSGEWDIGLQKTGYISEAGRCLVMQATIAAKPYIIVLLDAVGRYTRIADANRIKRWIEVRYAPRRRIT
ncbi:MAG: D-alanyl-D-alanine endopeptidase [Betaproteobacteria bacterium]|nr:D-alanyl-D-alanine endopeptidase [Betaproteobacteria bacterium]